MDVEMLQQYASEGLTRKEIAERMGMSYSRTTTVLRNNNIFLKRKKHECSPRGPRGYTNDILKLRRDGAKLKDIADTLGCHIDTVKGACRKYGLVVKQNVTTEDEAAKVIAGSGFDYVSGFVNTHGYVTVRCRDCGQTFERLFHIFRDVVNGTWDAENNCPICRKRQQDALRLIQEQKREQKRIEAERETQERAMRKAEQLSRKVNEQLAKRLAIHVCKNCGETFCIETSGYNSESYCSKRCQMRWHERIKNEKRMDKLMERPHDADITLEKLFKRDGGVCYICGMLCDRTDITEKNGSMIAGDRYPSIDHVKPVAKGGTHTWDNVRLACRACNTLKGWR